MVSVTKGMKNARKRIYFNVALHILLYFLAYLCSFICVLGFFFFFGFGGVENLSMKSFLIVESIDVVIMTITGIATFLLYDYWIPKNREWVLNLAKSYNKRFIKNPRYKQETKGMMRARRRIHFHKVMYRIVITLLIIWMLATVVMSVAWAVFLVSNSKNSNFEPKEFLLHAFGGLAVIWLIAWIWGQVAPKIKWRYRAWITKLAASYDRRYTNNTRYN